MQVAFHTDSISERNSAISNMGAHSLGLVSSNSNFRTGQSGVMSHKNQNENYSNARIYSPYLSPSSVLIMDMQNRRIDTDPTYVHKNKVF
jgi:hypothetical protein